uniref:Rab-GAP TBC domain-containing protein n=1 Tax=Rhabditophanes sp. KR3021 TaxID=114890 RepID=A0AC35UIN7_9BILA
MDFNINIWLKMAYYDPRLAHNSGSIILVNDYHVLQKLYRPSIFFINSRARFHDVTYRNAYMLIFENGVVFYEVGLFLQPSCQMYLRQYPFDSSSCNLRISSNSYTNDSLRFSWFAKDEDAVQMSKDIQLPDFYIRSHAFSKCDGRRKTGNYSCVEFKLNLKRNIYYHFARTYVPVTMCVILSWIGVFLPTEFVEGRIFCSLTVFLTLSAESTTAKELIPKLSYLTAIGIWFGVLSIFVFLTVLQALVVITLEYKSRALDQKLSISNMFADKNKFDEMTRKKIYCHRLAIKLDKTCRILYPLMFIIFLFVYYFIIISRDDGQSSSMQCHVFRSNVPDGAARALFAFSNSFKNQPPDPLEGFVIPMSKDIEIIGEHSIPGTEEKYQFESYLEIREDDGKGEFQSCPQENNCFRLRRDRIKKVMVVLRQISGPRNLPIKSCFGLLLAAGRNLKGSDMQLMDMESMGPAPQNKNVYVIAGLWNPIKESFEVLNTETPRETRVFMTVAADIIISGIEDSIRFYVECKARIYHRYEHFSSVIRRPIIEKYDLVTKMDENENIESGASLCETMGSSNENVPPVSDDLKKEESDPNQSLMKVISFESVTEQDRSLTRLTVGKNHQQMPTQLIHPADADDSDHDEPLLSGSGHVNQECSEEVMSQWEELITKWEADLENRPVNLGPLVKNGIPDKLRGRIWQWMSKVVDQELSDTYFILIEKECSCDSVILRDIHRTFPAHEFFKETNGEGQNALYKISKAYALYDEEVSYCQGLSFLVASLVLHMEQHKAFAVLVKIMFDYGLRDLYKLGFNNLQLRFYQLNRLLQTEIPQLYAHFEEIGIETHMYASSWLLTMFTAKFPLQCVFYIIDIFLNEGINTIFNISLALLNDSVHDFLELDFDSSLTYFRVTLPRKYRTEESAKRLIHRALNLNINYKKLEEYEVEYEENKAKELELMDPITRLEKDNQKLRLASIRLETENDDLAHELVTRKIELRHKLDATEEQLERSESNVVKLTRQNVDLEDENKSIREEYLLVKETCRREMDRLEKDSEKFKNIGDSYKAICSKLSEQIHDQKESFNEIQKSLLSAISNCESCSLSASEWIKDSPRNSKRVSPINEENSGIRMIQMLEKIDNQDGRIKQLELELAQTKLALVESQCQNQDLTHQMNTNIINATENNRPAWFKKTISSFKEVKGSLKSQVEGKNLIP